MARTQLSDRLLLTITALTTLLGPAFAVVVLPRPLSGSLVALEIGVAAQLGASVLVARLPRFPHIGLAAVLVVAALLRLDPPWQRLLAAPAVPWVAVALAWATVRVLGDARTPRQLRVSGVLAAGYLTFVGAVAGTGGGGGPTGNAVLGAAVPLLGGACASLLSRLRQARRDRAAALAGQRAFEARMDERQRVAEEVHDTLGHVLTLLVMHANALAVEPATREAGQRMSLLGRQGLAELRTILTLLDRPAATEPRDTGLVRPDQAIKDLVERSREAGQTVHLDAPDPMPAVTPAVAGALTRAVQEGLTNARRHAPGSDVRIGLTTADGTARVDIRNGPGDLGFTAPGTGRGLEGIRQRIGLLGGQCEHARTEDGGYALVVVLPVAGDTGPSSQDGV